MYFITFTDLSNIFESFLPQLLTYPNPIDPLNGDAAAMYLHKPEEYKKKVQVSLVSFLRTCTDRSTLPLCCRSGPQSMLSEPSVTTPPLLTAPALPIGSRDGHSLRVTIFTPWPPQYPPMFSPPSPFPTPIHWTREIDAWKSRSPGNWTSTKTKPVTPRTKYVRKYATEEALREQENQAVSSDSESSMSDFSEDETQDMEL
uniref:UBC core domain-containing protein n=1 Tax=Timema cristinae TaxID=61476 RepID=A0A7R9GRI0_TIMCR|nr:unnamed protein product [Timema cristinae]